MVRDDFYVYFYLMPDGTPVYVGKGRGSRDRSHLKIAEEINAGTFKGVRNRWYNFLAKRLREGVAMVVTRIEQNLDEGLAQLLEIQFILHFGRCGLDEGGTLRNTSGGGDGFTSEDKIRIQSTLAYQTKWRAALAVVYASPEWRGKRKAIAAEYSARPEWREKISSSSRQRAASGFYKTNYWKTKFQAGMERRNADPKWLESQAKKNRRIATPERNAKISASRKEWHLKNKVSTETRRKVSVGGLRHYKEHPERAKKHSEFLLAFYARRRREKYLTDLFVRT
jgi:hypothetical protein